MKKLNAILVLLLVSSCGGGFKVTDLSQETPPSQSPFVSNPVLVSPWTGSSSLSKGNFQYDLVINDICVKSRLGKSGRKFVYLVDQLVNPDLLVTDEKKVHESVVTVGFTTQKTEPELTQIAQADRCIVGLTNSKKVAVAPNDGFMPGGPKMDYKSFLGFAAADTFAQSNLPSSVKIKVAVIDSGYDIAGSGRTGLAASLQGSDMVDLDDNPQDTLGHGTAVSNILLSLLPRNVEIIPIRLFGSSKSRIISFAELHEAIKRAVNMGADIINMSFEMILDQELTSDLKFAGDPWSLLCPIVLGHSLQSAIDRNVFIVMSGGHGVAYRKFLSGVDAGKWINFKTNSTGEFVFGVDGEPVQCSNQKDPTCFPYPIRGPIVPVRQNGIRNTGNNSAPSCWTKYLKGALTTAALDGNKKIANFSNYGVTGVEIAAPGVGIEVAGLNKSLSVVNGTSLSSPMVATAAALAIGFHKAQQAKAIQDGKNPDEWSYNPWFIEDVILNGLSTESTLASGDKENNQQPLILDGNVYSRLTAPNTEMGIRRGKILSLSSLANYLSAMRTQDFATRRAQPTDNGELGQGYDPQLTTAPTAEMVGLQVYLEEPLQRNRNRIQAQAIAIYSNGSTRVVTDKVAWSVVTGLATIDAQGVIYPALTFSGTVAVQAKLLSQTGMATALVTNVDVLIGQASLVPDDLQIVVDPSLIGCSSIRAKVIAKYGANTVLNRTTASSWSVTSNYTIGTPYFFDNSKEEIGLYRKQSTAPGETIVITTFLYGKKAQYTLQAPLCKMDLSRLRQTFGEAGPSELGAVQKYSIPSSQSVNVYYSPACSADGGTRIDFCWDLNYVTDGFSSPLRSGYFKSFGDIVGNQWRVPASLSQTWGPGEPRVEFQFPKTWFGTADLMTIKTTLDVKPVVPAELHFLSGLNGTLFGKAPDFPGAASLVAEMVYSDGSKRTINRGEGKLWVKDPVSGADLLPARDSSNFANSFFILSFSPRTQTAALRLDLTSAQSGVTLTASQPFQVVQDWSFPVSQFSRTINLPLIQAGLNVGSQIRVFENSVQSLQTQPQPVCQIPSNRNNLPFASGTGTKTNPYVICTTSQFLAWGESSSLSNLGYFVLGDHLDLAGIVVPKVVKALEFNGQGYEIRNLTYIDADAGISRVFFDVKHLHDLIFRGVLIRGLSEFFPASQTEQFIRRVALVDSMLMGSKATLVSTFADIRQFHLVNVTFAEGASFSQHSRALWFDSYWKVVLQGSATSPAGGVFGYTTGNPLPPEKLVRAYWDPTATATNLSLNLTDPFPAGEAGVIANVYANIKMLSGGTGGAFADRMSGGTILSSEFVLDTQSAISGHGGLAGKTTAYFGLSLISNVKVSGFVRGASPVGCFFGTYDGGSIGDSTCSATVIGSDAVGGLIGLLEPFTFVKIYRNNTSGSTITSSGTNKSDMIGKFGEPSTRGGFEGPSYTFYQNIIQSGNVTKGAFLSDNQVALTTAFEAVINR